MGNADAHRAIKNTGQPGYLQIADDIREQIDSGELRPGALLRSTAQLCADYKVSPSVVKAAISVLRTEGLVIGMQGKGVFVTDPQDRRQSEGPESPEVATQLDQILATLRDLGERVAAIEGAVFPERSQVRRRGK